MNKRLLLTSTTALLIAGACLSQTVPNGGFENWTDNGAGLEPNGWTTLNSFAGGGGTAPVERVSQAAAGTYAAKVTTMEIDPLGVFPGILTLGDPLSGAVGVPFTQRPGSLVGQWKYAPVADDQGTVVVQLSKWNTLTNERDEVGTGVAVASAAVSAWSPFSAPITYISALTPDTLSISVLSGLSSEVAGSAIWLDALAFSSSTGVGEVSDASITMFPSPVGDQLTIRTDASMQDVRVFGMDGRIVAQQRVNDRMVVVDVAGLRAGAYAVVIRQADGSELRRIIVKDR